MDFIGALKIRALAGVMSPDDEAAWQDVFEWYSRTYATPLHTVPDLPLDMVLNCYYRHIYKSMDAHERHDAAVLLLETPEDRAKRLSQEKGVEEELIRKSMEANEKRKASKSLNKAEETFKKLKAGLGDKGPKVPKQEDEAPPPEPKLPEEEEIVVKYLSPEEFEASLDAFDNKFKKGR